jgi:NAD(P)H-flavin reductase
MNGTDPWLPRPFEITDRRTQTADTITIDLAPADGQPMPRYLPGQVSMLGVPGVGEAPISISGDHALSNALEHTLRVVGSVTSKIASLGVGDQVSVRSPFGTPWPLEQAKGRDLLVVAGGIGIAPLASVLHHAVAHRGDFGRVVLLYGARTPADLVFREWVDHLAIAEAVEVLITVDRADEAWRYDIGMVTRLIGRIGLRPKDTTAFICGPGVMMRAVASDLVGRGVGAGEIHVTMERNMQCAAGFCGHCQFGGEFICKDGPVFPWWRVADLFSIPEI